MLSTFAGILFGVGDEDRLAWRMLAFLMDHFDDGVFAGGEDLEFVESVKGEVQRRQTVLIEDDDKENCGGVSVTSSYCQLVSFGMTLPWICALTLCECDLGDGGRVRGAKVRVEQQESAGSARRHVRGWK
jgi:hypothetical protein